jgi:hypothetical protein
MVAVRLTGSRLSCALIAGVLNAIRSNQPSVVRGFMVMIFDEKNFRERSSCA